MQHFLAKDLSAWRAWLRQYHSAADGVWLDFRRSGTDQALTYEEAVCEALCWGWIDSIIKKINEDLYSRKFTPRKESSKWSESNKVRVGNLLLAGRIQPSGQKAIDAAKANGMWDKPDRPAIPVEAPTDFLTELHQHPRAERFFAGLAPSYRKQFLGWITMAKKRETRAQRITESIELLNQGKRLGLK